MKIKKFRKFLKVGYFLLIFDNLFKKKEKDKHVSILLNQRWFSYFSCDGNSIEDIPKNNSNHFIFF